MCLQVHDGFPFFVETQWYALDCYVATLTKPECSSSTARELGRPRKPVGRKKLKTDDEAGGDGKNQRTTCNDGDEDTAAADTDDSVVNDHNDAKLNRYLIDYASMS